MATSIALLDPAAVMSNGGLVDASTAEGQVEEADDWCGAVAAMLTANLMRETSATASRTHGPTAPRTAPLRRGAEWRYARVRRAARLLDTASPDRR